MVLLDAGKKAPRILLLPMFVDLNFFKTTYFSGCLRGPRHTSQTFPEKKLCQALTLTLIDSFIWVAVKLIFSIHALMLSISFFFYQEEKVL